MGMVQAGLRGVWKWNGEEDGDARGHNHLVLVDPVTGRPIDRKTGNPVAEGQEGNTYVAHADDIDEKFLRGVVNRTADLLPTTTRWNGTVDEGVPMQAENLAPAISDLGIDVFVGALARTLGWEKGANTKEAAFASDIAGGPTFMGQATSTEDGVYAGIGYFPWLGNHEGYDPNAVGFPSMPEGYWQLSEDERYEQAPVFQLNVDQVAYIMMTEYYVDSSISRLLEIPEVGAMENRTLIENVFDFAVNAGALAATEALQGGIFDLLAQHDPEWFLGKKQGGGDHTRKSFADGDIGKTTIDALRRLFELSGDSSSGLYEENVLRDLNRRVHTDRLENNRDPNLVERINSFQW